MDLFYKPGHSDITSHLNFKLFYEVLKKNNLNVKKITNQNEFLKKMGILERANILSKKMTFKEKARVGMDLIRNFMVLKNRFCVLHRFVIRVTAHDDTDSRC